MLYDLAKKRKSVEVDFYSSCAFVRRRQRHDGGLIIVASQSSRSERKRK